MSVVLPEFPSVPPVGRDSGTVRFLQGERIIGRRVTIPNDPKTPDQTSIRGTFATAAKRFANVLTQPQRDVWDAFSRFAGNGLLEFTATTIAASLADQALPLARTTDPIPPQPFVSKFDYLESPFQLRVSTVPMPPPGDQLLLFSATGPGVDTEEPDNKEMRFIGFDDASPPIHDFTAPYLAVFNDTEPIPRPLRTKIFLYAPSIPSFSDPEYFSTQLSDRPNRIELEVRPFRVPRLGSSNFLIEAGFQGVGTGVPLPLTVNPGSLIYTGPAAVPNNQQISATLTDALDHERTTTVQILVTGPAGRTNNLAIQPAVG